MYGPDHSIETHVKILILSIIKRKIKIGIQRIEIDEALEVAVEPSRALSYFFAPQPYSA